MPLVEYYIKIHCSIYKTSVFTKKVVNALYSQNLIFSLACGLFSFIDLTNYKWGNSPSTSTLLKKLTAPAIVFHFFHRINILLESLTKKLLHMTKLSTFNLIIKKLFIVRVTVDFEGYTVPGRVCANWWVLYFLY